MLARILIFRASADKAGNKLDCLLQKKNAKPQSTSAAGQQSYTVAAESTRWMGPTTVSYTNAVLLPLYNRRNEVSVAKTGLD